jgi:hypothetical protein
VNLAISPSNRKCSYFFTNFKIARFLSPTSCMCARLTQPSTCGRPVARTDSDVTAFECVLPCARLHVHICVVMRCMCGVCRYIAGRWSTNQSALGAKSPRNVADVRSLSFPGLGKVRVPQIEQKIVLPSIFSVYYPINKHLVGNLPDSVLTGRIADKCVCPRKPRSSPWVETLFSLRSTST